MVDVSKGKQDLCPIVMRVALSRCFELPEWRWLLRSDKERIWMRALNG